MGKKLSEMTLEELWQLFPIILTDHNEHWADWYAAEAARLSAFLPALTLSHVGSTAINGIAAKPIIDILAETEMITPALIEKIKASGYILMSRGEERASFNRGYTEEGFAERVYHLHLRKTGDHDEILFRDWLNTHPADAAAYEQLKLSLRKQYEHDRDGYTAAKAPFVKAIMGKIRGEQDA